MGEVLSLSVMPMWEEGEWQEGNNNGGGQLTRSERARKMPGNPLMLCGAREVMTMHEMDASLMRCSWQKRCVPSPTFTSTRLKTLFSARMDFSTLSSEEWPDAL